jgi:hypothetical protein
MSEPSTASASRIDCDDLNQRLQTLDEEARRIGKRKTDILEKLAVAKARITQYVYQVENSWYYQAKYRQYYDGNVKERDGLLLESQEVDDKLSKIASEQRRITLESISPGRFSKSVTSPLQEEVKDPGQPMGPIPSEAAAVKADRSNGDDPEFQREEADTCSNSVSEAGIDTPLSSSRSQSVKSLNTLQEEVKSVRQRSGMPCNLAGAEAVVDLCDALVLKPQEVDDTLSKSASAQAHVNLESMNREQMGMWLKTLEEKAKKFQERKANIPSELAVVQAKITEYIYDGENRPWYKMEHRRSFENNKKKRDALKMESKEADETLSMITSEQDRVKSQQGSLWVSDDTTWTVLTNAASYIVETLL